MGPCDAPCDIPCDVPHARCPASPRSVLRPCCPTALFLPSPSSSSSSPMKPSTPFPLPRPEKPLSNAGVGEEDQRSLPPPHPLHLPSFPAWPWLSLLPQPLSSPLRVRAETSFAPAQSSPAPASRHNTPIPARRRERGARGTPLRQVRGGLLGASWEGRREAGFFLQLSGIKAVRGGSGSDREGAAGKVSQLGKKFPSNHPPPSPDPSLAAFKTQEVLYS